MSKDVFVFEVNQKSFDQAVLLNSHKIPVVVEFMGVWSGPCAAMDHLFSSLAKEFPEQFIFAKVDIDEQPELRKEYNIENVPTLMVFKDGKLARKEVGELKEDEARQLLRDFGVVNPSDVMREEARQKHMNGDTPGAMMLLAEAIKTDPANTRVVMDMVQIFIDLGEFEQADGLFNRLPEPIRESELGKALKGQLVLARHASQLDDIETLQSRLAANADDHDARFDLSIRMMAQYRNDEAIDNLFIIFQKAPDFKEGAAKEMLINLANTLESTNNELSQKIRRQMANLMSS